MAIPPASLAALIPGGLPDSPWPLVLSSVALALLLTAVGVVLLWRMRELVLLREQFVSSVSHELRTPLAQILAYAETLQLDRPTPAARGRAATVIVRETRRLAHLVENALSFARGQRPEASLSFQAEELAHVIREMEDSLQDLARTRQARVELDLEPCPGVTSDRQALQRILTNLVDNALRYGPEGQRVTVVVRPDGEWAELRVEDEGPGVPAEIRDWIWKPFKRLAYSPDDTGAGLGLAIVRQLAELHGGESRVEAGAHGGASFVVRLPRDPGPNPSTAAGPASPSNAEAVEV